MRLTTNEKLIARQSKFARYATFAGLAILLGSLVMSFTNSDLLIAYLALFVGFIFAMIGSTLANKWIKEPRADVALEKSLKGIDNKHHLFNYLLPAEHVLLTPTGILVFKVKPNEGTITLKNGKWHQPWKLSRLFGGMGQEGLDNPLRDLNNEIDTLRKLIANKITNAALVPIDGYIVFTSPKVTLTLDDATMPAVQAEDLKDTLRKSKRGAPLAQKTLDEIELAFKEFIDAKTAK